MACDCGCAALGWPHDLAHVGGVRFRLRTTNDSSARLGPCEVCGVRASEVFIQSAYLRGHLDVIEFGHRACLTAQRETHARAVVS